MAIIDHSKFIPVFLGNIVRKRLEQTFLAIPNLYQSSGKNCWKKFRMAIIDHSKFIPVFLGNIVRKRLEQTFLAIPNLYQSFWEKLLEKIRNNHFWPFQIYTSLWETLSEKNWKKFLAIPNLYQSFWEKLLELAIFWLCLIYTSLLGKNCQKKIGTTIFGHS